MEIKKLIKNSLYIIPFFILAFSIFSFIKGISDNPFDYLVVYDGAGILKFILTFSMGLTPIFILLGVFSAIVITCKPKEIIISAVTLIGLTFVFIGSIMMSFGGELPVWFWSIYLTVWAGVFIFSLFLKFLNRANPILFKLIFLILYIICLFLIGKIFTQVRWENLSNCAGIKNDDRKTACYLSVAKKTNDIDICNKITGLKGYCYEEISNQRKKAIDKLNEIK